MQKKRIASGAEVITREDVPLRLKNKKKLI